MSILIDKSTRVIIQGITGATGQFHAKASETRARSASRAPRG